MMGCAEFLELKPDQKMAVPNTLNHADLLLSDYSTMNTGYPSLGQVACDEYYLNTEDWNALPEEDEKAAYTWSDQIMMMHTQWQNAYKTVYVANQVLEILDNVARNMEPVRYGHVLGGAHFFRAFALHQLAGVYTLPYQSSTADQELGIPLRLSPALDYKSVRSTLQATYDQIIADYKDAIKQLPITEPRSGRPHKAAAYAGLARVYLDMQDYEKAYRYADSCLMFKSDLLNYQELDAESPLPIARFNKEVLFAATMVFTNALGPYYARITPELFTSYEDSDLRKKLFFEENESDAGTYAFKGSYDNTTGAPFVGLTSSEVYLIRAESAVRTGKSAMALADINKLLEHRIVHTDFAPVSETDPKRLLSIIINERRKELVFRGLRWGDLRRLNQEESFRKTLNRTIDGKIYTLEPNTPKYALLIPDLVITESGMPQNKR
ncbi:hypothetical protein M472_01055 [Sphingobacterium paucimobilis HER1398]|uniref:RagB/SusD domain-containing protein n=2 Tax=Sphingobacterium TaxID=28453 RepID=U2IXA9_9SPHI|nr:hypothetical protein M472_01055 [Sphingobacterium paucimobilis HER1398]